MTTRPPFTLHPNGTVTFSRPPRPCVCGHGIELHAHTQGRSWWGCEASDCGCEDFEEVPEDRAS